MNQVVPFFYRFDWRLFYKSKRSFYNELKDERYKEATYQAMLLLITISKTSYVSNAIKRKIIKMLYQEILYLSTEE